MKKLIIITVALLAYGGFCKAEKQVTLTDLQYIHFNGDINYKVGEDYYPLMVYFDGVATSTDGVRKNCRAPLYIGTSSTTAFDLKTDEGQKRFYQALPAFLKPVLLDLRDQATGDDLSQ